MKRMLRDMRYLAAELARRGMRQKADRLLDTTERLPSIRQPEWIRGLRGELLTWELPPNLQDDVSGILSQLRAREQSLHSFGG